MVCGTCGAQKIQRYRHGKKSGWYCRPCATARIKAYRCAQPEKYLDNKLWTFYRIRLADYQRMVVEQDGRCAACGDHTGELADALPALSRGFNGNGLVIDHDHRCCGPSSGGRNKACGKCIRGLLCQPCNIALGMARDDPVRLENLAAYVRKWEGVVAGG